MSDNEIENTQISKLIDLERYKNAEQLAKALKAYLPSPEETSKSRGRTKDKRICQLSAAYKYCVHLENAIKDLCDKENKPVPDDCKLVHNLPNLNASRIDLTQTQTSTNSSIMYKRLDQNNNEIADQSESHLYLTPNQQRSSILHESSNLSVGSNAVVKTNFNAVDASPILGRKSFFLYDNNNNSSIQSETNANVKKRKISNCSSNQDAEQESSTVDSHNENSKMNKTENNKENVLYTPNSLIYTSSPSTASTSSNSSSTRRTSTRTKSAAKTNENNNNIEVRRHYFLRSTNRLKDMLVANNIGSKVNTNEKNTKLDSSITSSRLSSLTATPSIRTNSDMSSASSLHELDTLDPRLSRVSLTDEHMPQMY